MKKKSWIIYNSALDTIMGVYDTRADAVGFLLSKLTLTEPAAKKLGYHIRRATFRFQGVKINEKTKS